MKIALDFILLRYAYDRRVYFETFTKRTYCYG